MIRRMFLKSLAALFTTASLPSQKKPSDRDYVDANVGDGFLYYVLLNGKFVFYVRRANVIEGWVDAFQIKKSYTPLSYWQISRKTKRLYGNIQILKGTPQLNAEYDQAWKKAKGVWTR